jgi:hypothetical protein
MLLLCISREPPEQGCGAEKTYWNSLAEQTSEKMQPVGLTLKGRIGPTT